MAFVNMPKTKESDNKLSIYYNLINYLRGDALENYYKRKFEITKLWNFYLGNQSIYLEKYEGESDAEYMSRVQNTTIENHCRPTVDIAVAYLYGDGDKIVRRAIDPTLHEILVNNIWKVNDMTSFMIDVRINASVTGYSLVEPVLIKKSTGKPYEPGEPINKEDISILYTLLDSTIAIPLPRIYDMRSLGAVIKFYSINSIDLLSGYDIDIDFKDEIWILEYIDDNVWLRFAYPDDKYDKPVHIPVFADGEDINPFGDVRDAFVLFRNAGDPASLEGLSEIEGLITMQTNLNERLSDDRLTIRYHSAPIIKFLKGAQAPDSWIRKPNSILEFDGDGNAEYLTWEDRLQASFEYTEQLRKSIAITSGVSSLSRGNLRDIGQLRTSVGVKSLFVPDIANIKLRRAFMTKGEKDLIKATARQIEYYTGIKFECYCSEIIMPEDFIGIDKWLETQILAQKIQAGLPIIEELRIQFPDKTEEELQELQQKLIGKKADSSMMPPPEAKSVEKDPDAGA